MRFGRMEVLLGLSRGDEGLLVVLMTPVLICVCICVC